MRQSRSCHPLFVAALCALSLAAAGPALGAGSGGGGGGGAPSAPQVDVSKLYQEGVQALEARDYARASSKLREAARAAPDAGVVNYAYALALLGKGDATAARRPLERAVRDRTSPADAHLQLGLLYFNAGDLEKANARVTALNVMIAACDAACGDARRQTLQAAQQKLKAALEAPTPPAADPAQTGWNLPDAGAGRVKFAAAVELINAGDFAAALPVLAQAGEAIGPHPDVLTYQGFANRKLGRFDEAMHFYQAALKLNPNHRGATEYLGEFYVEQGQLTKARAQLAKLDRLCPYGCAEREELARWIAARG